jgi:hypothetical protein
MTDKEAMKLALFALDIVKIHYTQSRHINEAITALKDRLADPMREVKRLGQEIEQDFHLHDEDNEGGWTDWICPKPDSYLMKCCDCGLVHEMQTRVVDYESRPSEDFVVSNNPDLQAQFRVRRHEVFDTTPPQRTEPICPECKAEVLYECVACSSNNYPPPQRTEQKPYANYCEATAFKIDIKNLRGEIKPLKAPQRTWVELTDEEFHKACWESYVDPVTGECSTGDREYAVHWTQAKLKEKNNG